MLPTIALLKASEQATIDNGSNATAGVESRAKIPQLEQAQKGWQRVIDRDDQLYVDAKGGKLKAVTQLVADALLQEKGNDNVKFINETKAPNADALRKISAIRYSLMPASFKQFGDQMLPFCSFGGYGASISYSESSSADSSSTTSLKREGSVMVTYNIDTHHLLVSTGPHVKLELHGGSTAGYTTGTQKSKSISRTRGFTLSDDDEYDAFDVQV